MRYADFFDVEVSSNVVQAVIPEPGSAALLLLGLAGLARLRR